MKAIDSIHLLNAKRCVKAIDPIHLPSAEMRESYKSNPFPQQSRVRKSYQLNPLPVRQRVRESYAINPSPVKSEGVKHIIWTPHLWNNVCIKLMQCIHRQFNKGYAVIIEATHLLKDVKCAVSIESIKSILSRGYWKNTTLILLQLNIMHCHHIMPMLITINPSDVKDMLRIHFLPRKEQHNDTKGCEVKFYRIQQRDDMPL